MPKNCKVQFSSAVSDKECPKSSVRLVSDNAQVRSITRNKQIMLDEITYNPNPSNLAPFLENENPCRCFFHFLLGTLFDLSIDGFSKIPDDKF